MDPKKLDISEVYYFILIIRAGGISAAARSLDIPKANLSRKLASLEKKMGVSLVKRQTRRLTLTQEGTSLFNRTETHFSQIVSEIDTLVSDRHVLTGELKIALSVSLASETLYNLVSKFSEKFPAVKLTFDVVAHTPNLNNEDYDLAIYGTNELPPNVIAYKLIHIKLKTFASKKFLERYGLPESPQDLSRFPAVSMSGTDKKFTLKNSKTDKEVSFKVNSVISSNQPSVIMKAVLNDRGFSFFPKFVFENEIKTGEIKAILPDWNYSEFGLYMVYLKHKVRNPKIKEFVNFLKENFIGPDITD